MRRRLAALTGATALVFSAAVAGMTVSSAPAEASTPVLAGSCGATVTGAPGTPITLRPSVLLSPVENVLSALPLVNITLGPLVNGVVNQLPPIPIGTIPSSNTTISGGTIGGAASSALRKTALAPIADAVGNALAGTCTVLVKVVNAATAPVEDGTKAIADASNNAQRQLGLPTPGGGGSGSGGSGGTGGGTGSGSGGGAGGGHGPVSSMPQPNNPVLGGGLGGGDLQLYDPDGLPYNFGRSPMADYANLPFAQPGVFSPAPGVRYGGSVPGYSPQFGILGGGNGSDGVQAAGHAESLAAPAGDRVALPVLLAVLALSGATAALVRTWVLRRTIVS